MVHKDPIYNGSLFRGLSFSLIERGTLRRSALWLLHSGLGVWRWELGGERWAGDPPLLASLLPTGAESPPRGSPALSLELWQMIVACQDSAGEKGQRLESSFSESTMYSHHGLLVVNLSSILQLGPTGSKEISFRLPGLPLTTMSWASRHCYHPYFINEQTAAHRRKMLVPHDSKPWIWPCNTSSYFWV